MNLPNKGFVSEASYGSDKTFKVALEDFMKYLKGLTEAKPPSITKENYYEIETITKKF